eukprot:gene7354-10024_t
MIKISDPIKCRIGYGQRGLLRSDEIGWVRTCPNTNYCFEAVTTDIKKVQKLIDYPWDSYYSQYFIHSCGGDYGTDIHYDPYIGRPKSVRKFGVVKINITTPHIITGHGGTELLLLKYFCKKDLCSSMNSFHLFVKFTQTQ